MEFVYPGYETVGHVGHVPHDSTGHFCRELIFGIKRLIYQKLSIFDMGTQETFSVQNLILHKKSQ